MDSRPPTLNYERPAPWTRAPGGTGPKGRGWVGPAVIGVLVVLVPAGALLLLALWCLTYN
jgi:hypothetical protein